MAIYYVSISGNDSNSGSIGSPFLTLQKGLNTAQPGDTVQLLSGTFSTAASVRNGTSGNLITIQGQNDMSSVISAAGGSNSANAVYITHAYHVVKKLYCNGARIWVSGDNAHDNLIDSNTVINAYTGIRCSEGTTGPYNNKFSNNDFSHWKSNGGMAVNGHNNIFSSNSIHDNDGWDGFRVFGHDNLIQRNEIYNFGTATTGNHSDLFQNFGDQFGLATNTTIGINPGANVSYNITVDGNYIHDSTCQIATLQAYNSPATTVSAGSNGQSLPQATINIADGTVFDTSPSTGVLGIVTSNGIQSVKYTGHTATTLTGCSGGGGTMSTGNLVYLQAQTAAATSTATSSGFSLPQSTIPVGSTAIVPTGNKFLAIRSSNGVQIIAYTGTQASPPAFTGCNGGTGSVNSGETVFKDPPYYYHPNPDVRDWTFTNNILSGVRNYFGLSQSGTQFCNNTIYNSAASNAPSSAISIGKGKGFDGTNTKIKNNIFALVGSTNSNGYYAIPTLVTGIESDYNFVSGPTAGGAKTNFSEVHGINGGDPGFISSVNLSLQAGSVCKGVGVDLSAVFTDDALGVTRSVPWDMGAYAFAAASGKIIGLSIEAPSVDLAFGDQTVGTSITRNVIVSNSGGLTLTVTNVTGFPTGTSTSQTFNFTVAAGASHSVPIIFAPLAIGAISGTLTFVSDKTGGTNTIAISGNGTPVPSIGSPHPDRERSGARKISGLSKVV